MIDKVRIAIASAVTALFLAAVSAAGLAAHGARPPMVGAPVNPGAPTAGSGALRQPQSAPTSNQQEHD
jgi:hypothetical protein